MKAYHDEILQLSSDNEALTFHKKFTSKPQSSQDSATRQNASKKRKAIDPISLEEQTTITTFWAALATIGMIQEFRMGQQSPLRDHLSLGTTPSDAQREWLLSKYSLEGLKPLLEFQQKLSTSFSEEALALPFDNEYARFANFHDQSNSSPGNPEWVNLFNDLGFKGIENRLQEYWHQQESQNPKPISDAHKQAYIQQYIASKLLPMFHTYFLTHAIQVEAQAHEVAWESWYRIQQWQQQEQSNQAILRLCGTWKWIIHNHQNHGDHKTTTTFSPPGQDTPPHVQPTTVLIHGDAVYLKWTFPQGIQEDSLLLSNHDTRLEGTFRNSRGPHGSISGQRLSPCQHE
ncbi:MAG: hypothetical protein WD032_08485 [Nitrospirales bacterium]